MVIWTTTPWTIPANRAIAYGENIAYGLYEVTGGGRRQLGEGRRSLRARRQARRPMCSQPPRVDRLRAREGRAAGHDRAHARIRSAGSTGANGYWDFAVPVLPADYVTDDAGTGFVHTAPGHGADDYNTFIKHKAVFEACGTPQVPHTVVAGFVLLSRHPVLRRRTRL